MEARVADFNNIISDIFALAFKAKVTCFELKKQNQMSFLFSRHQYGNDFFLRIKSQIYETPTPQFSREFIFHYIKDIIFEEAFHKVGYLKSIDVECDSLGFEIAVIFAANDFDEVCETLKQINWKLYSEAFENDLANVIAD